MAKWNPPRQGDVFLVRVKDVPTGVKPVTAENGRIVLAHGEATGHHHSIAFSDRVALFREDGSGGGLFLSVNAPSVSLEHQEHTALEIKHGTYRVVRQRTMSAGLVRRVED